MKNVYSLYIHGGLMTTKVQRWGNSLALRIPGSFAKDIHLQKGAAVDLSIEGDRLVIRPFKSHKYSLPALLKKIHKNNLHSEIETGKAFGREIW
jgi:antitoxin MazE